MPAAAKIGNLRKHTGSGDRAAGGFFNRLQMCSQSRTQQADPTAWGCEDLWSGGWRHGIRERAAIRYPSMSLAKRQTGL
jgi:hypothetical protein